MNVGTICRKARRHTSEVATFSNIPKGHNLMGLYMVRDCSVGTAASYELHGPVLESRWRGDFPHSSRLDLVPIQPTGKWVPILISGAKRSAPRVDPLQPIA